MKKYLTFSPFLYQQAKEKIERVSEVSFFFSSECVLQTNLWPPTVICQKTIDNPIEGATHKAQQLKQADNLRPIIPFQGDIAIEQWAPERLVSEG